MSADYSFTSFCAGICHALRGYRSEKLSFLAFFVDAQ